jgi:nucleotide-binding universal stress UspA family protein
VFDTVLVPTDGSECAETAAEYAMDVTTRYEATVHVLCVADSRTLETAPHSERIRAERTDLAERVCADFSAAGIPVEQAARTDVPHGVALGYAPDEEIDSIVVGTHGRREVERYLLGSVAEKMVRTSPVPGVTVRRSERE